MSTHNSLRRCQDRLRFGLFAVCLAVAGCGVQSERTPTVVETHETPMAASTVEPMADGQASENFKSSGPSDPVAVRLQASRESAYPGDQIDIVVTMEIDPMYEIHEMESPPPSISTELVLVLPTEFKSKGDWTLPQRAASSRPDGHRVYVSFLRPAPLPRSWYPPLSLDSSKR